VQLAALTPDEKRTARRKKCSFFPGLLFAVSAIPQAVIGTVPYESKLADSTRVKSHTITRIKCFN
jgi:hypothetical protein